MSYNVMNTIYICIYSYIFISIYLYIYMYVYVYVYIYACIYRPIGDSNAHREVGGWGRDPKKCTGRDWGMGSSTIQ